MATGKVKWFNNVKGYGFINEDGRAEDLFVHYSNIQMDGFRTLRAGQQVAFDIIQGPRGLHAVAIRPSVSDAGAAERSNASVRLHFLEV